MVRRVMNGGGPSLFRIVGFIATLCALYFGLKAEIVHTATSSDKSIDSLRIEHRHAMGQIMDAIGDARVADSSAIVMLERKVDAQDAGLRAEMASHEELNRRQWALTQRQWEIIWRRLGEKYIPEQ